MNDATYSRSIGFDATRRDDLVVTVGLSLNRTQEALLLDTLYQELHSEGYLPFRTKSRDLSLPPATIDTVLRNCNGDLGICIHQDDVKLPFAEATHSAILLDELAVPTNKSIVIVDGDDSKSKLFRHATTGLDLAPPPVVHCTQSELYYPHLLFADLVAGRIADEIESGSGAAHDIQAVGPIATVTITTDGGDHWGPAYHAATRQEGGLSGQLFEQRHASSFRERVTCWFHGWFGHHNAHPPVSESVSPVAGRLQAIECKDVAQWIAEQQ